MKNCSLFRVEKTTLGNINGLEYVQDFVPSRDEEEEEADEGKAIMFFVNLSCMIVLFIFIGYQIVMSNAELLASKPLMNIKDYAVRIHSIDKNYKGDLESDIKSCFNDLYGDNRYDFCIFFISNI